MSLHHTMKWLSNLPRQHFTPRYFLADLLTTGHAIGSQAVDANLFSSRDGLPKCSHAKGSQSKMCFFIRKFVIKSELPVHNQLQKWALYVKIKHLLDRFVFSLKMFSSKISKDTTDTQCTSYCYTYTLTHIHVHRRLSNCIYLLLVIYSFH